MKAKGIKRKSSERIEKRHGNKLEREKERKREREKAHYIRGPAFLESLLQTTADRTIFSFSRNSFKTTNG